MDYCATNSAGTATPALAQSAGKIALLASLITVRSASSPIHMAMEPVVGNGHGTLAVAENTGGVLSAILIAETASTTLRAAFAPPTAPLE